MKKIKGISLWVVVFVMIISMAVCTTSANTPEYIIRYAFTSPQSSQVGKIVEGFKERIEDLSGGRIEVQMFPDAILGDKLENMESLRVGNLEMTDANAVDLSGYNGRWSVFSFPYNFNDAREMIDVCRSEKVFKMLDADAIEAGFKIISFCDFGSRSVFSNTYPIYNPEDVKGMKVRVMQDPMLVKSMELMGFNAIGLGWSEVYTALQQGVIDACEQNEALCADNMLFEVAKYYSHTEHFRIPGLQWMSLKFFDSLPEDLQKAVIQAGIENEEYVYEWFPEYNEKSIEVLKENGVVFNETDKDAFAKLVEPLNEYYFSLSSTPDDARELYEALITARTAYRNSY